jgi:hypothetical protein
VGVEKMLIDIKRVFAPAHLLKPDVNFVHCDERLGVLVGQNSALEVELVVELLRCLGSRKSGFVL